MRAGLALGLGLGLALLLAARRRRRAVREVLFFPSRHCCTEELLAEAEGRGGRPAPCPCPLPRADCSFSRLLRRLLSARRSLELCLFAFSSPELGRAVCVLHRRGVRVRVVTDSQYMALRGSQIGVLRLLGIQVRHNQDVAFMHHKFAIVDKKLLITGSLNWTVEAIHSNRENVVIMEDAEYVRPFLDEFERIWEECNPGNYTFSS
ncbi:mitochondrial cardiolipin hydrolase [Gallus gallus]|uniref:mitochondrial cardiolipin hydrolase n=1 Tax=Gallus gallus TaxID=9031 RepID=UPI000739F120|nr:mitochondrial cardiolipin hydrolase [Gallus gallus]XP_040539360.1 mitochondrial cardiolipin hydrolase [Gallus gallus]|eukprot:XP_015149893.1 mitochondrial cardiolipin hydrolase [Gallus gallus]